eukprot:TRINITY_DN38371_c0_g1_i1.p1 TRINITY_DN38371_c0_g1~~TRINITY_DN38371_c0_g1_i1.p1  ORF type:complete len:305 (-),score=56.37 TRINITY_DN38371_c0_g1_i1:174-1088(-)
MALPRVADLKGFGVLGFIILSGLTTLGIVLIPYFKKISSCDYQCGESPCEGKGFACSNSNRSVSYKICGDVAKTAYDTCNDEFRVEATPAFTSYRECLNAAPEGCGATCFIFYKPAVTRLRRLGDAAVSAATNTEACDLKIEECLTSSGLGDIETKVNACYENGLCRSESEKAELVFEECIAKTGCSRYPRPTDALEIGVPLFGFSLALFCLLSFREGISCKGPLCGRIAYGVGLVSTLIAFGMSLMTIPFAIHGESMGMGALMPVVVGFPALFIGALGSIISRLLLKDSDLYDSAESDDQEEE